MSKETEKTTRKFAERMKSIGGRIKEKSVKTASWLIDHAGVVWGALFAGIVIFLKGFFKGQEEERRNLERRKDTAFQLAMRNAGVTDSDLDTINKTMDLVEEFGGTDEVRCLFNADYEEWCNIHDKKENES